MTPQSKSFSVITDDTYLSIAELTLITDIFKETIASSIEDSLFKHIADVATGEWAYFNRIKVPDKLQGKGIGKQLMQQVVDWADAENVNIYCPMNPYGILDLENLRKFYHKYGFVDIPNTKEEIYRLSVENKDLRIISYVTTRSK